MRPAGGQLSAEEGDSTDDGLSGDPALPGSVVVGGDSGSAGRSTTGPSGETMLAADATEVGGDVSVPADVRESLEAGETGDSGREGSSVAGSGRTSIEVSSMGAGGSTSAASDVVSPRAPPVTAAVAAVAATTRQRVRWRMETPAGEGTAGVVPGRHHPLGGQLSADDGELTDDGLLGEDGLSGEEGLSGEDGLSGDGGLSGEDGLSKDASRGWVRAGVSGRAVCCAVDPPGESMLGRDTADGAEGADAADVDDAGEVGDGIESWLVIETTRSIASSVVRSIGSTSARLEAEAMPSAPAATTVEVAAAAMTRQRVRCFTVGSWFGGPREGPRGAPATVLRRPEVDVMGT